jgi:hypothetical protein
MNGSSSSSSSETLGSPVATKPALGAGSRPLRFLVVTLAVAVYMALGFLLHTDVIQYLLLGIPLLLLFQIGVHRQPLRTMWVRSGPPIRLDPWFFGLWVLFSLVPIYALVMAAQQGNVELAVYVLVAIIGAFGLTYAVRAMRPANVRQLGLCILTCCLIYLIFLLLNLRNLHVPALLPGLLVGVENLLLLVPVTFVMEEVFFRGVLDTYLRQGEEGIGWLSAIFLSALWGLWHLPIVHPLQPLALIITVLLIFQIAIGVPLSIWWRRSGNLTVPGTTHALLDTIRNVLIGVPV